MHTASTTAGHYRWTLTDQRPSVAPVATSAEGGEEKKVEEGEGFYKQGGVLA